MQYYLMVFAFIFVAWKGIFFIRCQEEPSSLLDKNTQQAIKESLDFIKSKQMQLPPNQGVFGDYEGDIKYGIATTSFACLALMANGSLPDEGPYRENIKAGLEFILQCAEKNSNGYITRQGDSSRMHGHGFATLFLAQAYGTCLDPKTAERIRTQLKRAVNCIIVSQTEDGGWGYYPGDPFHEGSITICELQALRAARDVGIFVDKKVIDRAVHYLRRSANSDGTFKYRLGMDTDRKSFPLTAAGVSSLNATGEYEMKEIKNGLEFMMQYLPPHGKSDEMYHAYYYYGHFYAAQAMYHAPSHYWKKWFPAIKKDLLSRRNNSKASQSYGAWGETDPTYGRCPFGIVYATANATLILQIPYGYLPIFQK